ncbi:MAG: nucleoside diphosphate kinase regulator [Bacteriovoracia bacterium]
MTSDTLLMTVKDAARIKHALSIHPCDDAENLELEIERARLIADNEVPADLVTMNSRLRYQNVTDNKEAVVTLVFPENANASEGKISVLAPLGAALIGLSVGESITWKFPDGRIKELKVLELEYQPEASGDWHL